MELNECGGIVNYGLSGKHGCRWRQQQQQQA
jgi:hypothetical protein